MANVNPNASGCTSLTRLLLDGTMPTTGYGDNEVIPKSGRVASVTLTNAQLLALFTTPITIVPAPAVGHYIVIHDVVFNYVFNTAAYANGGGGDVELRYDTGTSDIITAASITPFFTAGASAIDQLPIIGCVILAGKAVVIEKATANFTGGNAGASMTVTVFYDVI